MNIKPIHPNFKLPTKSTSGAGAYDLYMPEAGDIPDLESVRVKLGFAAEVPEGYIALLAPRSGAGSKHTVELSNTVGYIDSDYRGEWIAKLQTKTGLPYAWESGDRVLQFALVPVLSVDFNVVDELNDTDRSKGGFGSTGL